MTEEGYHLFLAQNPCRCCGLEKNSGINLQDPHHDRVEKLLRSLSLLPKKIININLADTATKFICVECEMTLLHIRDFCEMVKKVQKKLKPQHKSQISNPSKNLQAKGLHKTDCHLTGSSSDGAPVVISVGGDGQMKCEDCQSTLTMSQLETLHMLTHGLGSVLCACKHCGHRNDIGQFLHHEKNTVKCPECSFDTYQAANTSTDQNEKTETEGGHVCEVCNSRFRTKYRYNRHKLIHMGVKPFLCETCGMKFNQKTGLKLHVLKHAKSNPHSCQWCGQVFRFKVSLQSHILNIHGNVTEVAKKYECDQCHKPFATSYKLQRHYRLHTGDRPYACPICNKFFSQSGNLKNHIKKHKSDNNFAENFNTDQLLENDQILETILDSCPQGKEFIDLQPAGQSYSLVNTGNVDKHNQTDLFSDFNPQDVLFDNTPIPVLSSENVNSSIILPNFSSIQGGAPDINL